jgi:hypothetical protein
MSNSGTKLARHNDREIGDIVGAFRRERERIAGRLELLSDADFARIATHPRLNIPMRLVDAVQFVCAHDDYHLARVREILRHGHGAG